MEVKINLEELYELKRTATYLQNYIDGLAKYKLISLTIELLAEKLEDESRRATDYDYYAMCETGEYKVSTKLKTLRSNINSIVTNETTVEKLAFYSKYTDIVTLDENDLPF